MASPSFALSNHIINRKYSAIWPPRSTTLRRSLRVSAAYATAERGSQNQYTQTASLYEVLGIQTGATSQEIKSAYRKLARVLHPDIASNHGYDDKSSTDEFMRVHAAYATLSDPEKRAVYDCSLFRRRRRPVVSLARGCSEMTPWRRTWETDQCW